MVAAKEAARRGSTWWASIRIKITLPYVLLAIALALAGAYVITQLIVDSVQERFINQLLESGRMVADRVVVIEDEALATLRTLAHTEGLAEAVKGRDLDTLDRLIFPVAVNDGTEVVDLLDTSGKALYLLHHRPGGGPADYDHASEPLAWNEYPFIQKVLQGESDVQGDKFAGLVEAPWGRTLYVAGPLYQGDTLVGVVLVGHYMTTLPDDLRQASAAHHITLYALTGTPLATTFPEPDMPALRINPELVAQTLAQQESAVPRRYLSIQERGYAEILGPLKVRDGGDVGLFGAAMAESFLVQASPITQAELALFLTAAFLSVILVGTTIAQRISRPIQDVARASRRAANGDLDQRVQVHTRDEIADLALSFNKMLEDLKQAQLVRDIFGRAVSPEVSRVLIEAMSSGEVALTGECRQVTTLFAVIRGFTSLSEALPPAEVLSLINDVLGAFITVISDHEGVVNKFGGDSLLAIFGAPVDQPDHASRAVTAGLEMIRQLAQINAQRQERGVKPIEVGIGINTGEVVAGLTGSAKRLEYTVIGDVVNTTARVQSLARQYNGYTLFITAATLAALEPEHGLKLENLGELPLRGKAEPVQVYAVRS